MNQIINKDELLARQLQKGEVVIDAFDAPTYNIDEYVSCRIVREKNGVLSGEFFDREDNEWVGDGDLHPIWANRILELINELSKNDPIVKVRELREDVRQKVIAWNDGDGADKMVQRALNRVLTRIDELFPDDLEDKRHEEV
jgi:hypothetical protein